MTLQEQRIIGLISFFTSKTKFCGRTKLAKLLFYCDWKHLKETGRTITGITYLTYKFGPLSSNLNDALKNAKTSLGKFIRYREWDENSARPIMVTVPFDSKLFSPFELKVIDDAEFIFKEATSDQMVRISHGIDEPWTKTVKTEGLHRPIDEKLAFAEKDAKISLDEYLERKDEIEEAQRMVYGPR